jgi:hypothetical protein
MLDDTMIKNKIIKTSKEEFLILELGKSILKKNKRDCC